MSINVTQFVSGLFKAKEQKTMRDGGEWRKLICDVAAGKARSPDETLAALERLGRTPEELQAALLKLQRRTALAAKLAAFPEAEAELKKAEAERDKAFAALRAAEELHQPVIDRAAYRIDALNRQLAEAYMVRSDLINSGSDPLVEARIAGMKTEINAMPARIADQKDLRGRIGQKLIAAKSDLEKTCTEVEHQLCRDTFRELTTRYDEASATLRDLEARQNSLCADVERAREAYLDPSYIV